VVGDAVDFGDALFSNFIQKRRKGMLIQPFCSLRCGGNWRQLSGWFGGSKVPHNASLLKSSIVV
jgi:hypothetical protein